MPSKSKTLNALYDLRDNIIRAQGFLFELTFQAFLRSQLHIYAATRALEIISEASRRLPDELRNRHADVPWRAIRDSGNVYRHQYDNVIESQVWAVIHERLPALLDVVNAEIALIEHGTPLPDGSNDTR